LLCDCQTYIAPHLGRRRRSAVVSRRRTRAILDGEFTFDLFTARKAPPPRARDQLRQWLARREIASCAAGVMVSTSPPIQARQQRSTFATAIRRARPVLVACTIHVAVQTRKDFPPQRRTPTVSLAANRMPPTTPSSARISGSSSRTNTHSLTLANIGHHLVFR